MEVVAARNVNEAYVLGIRKLLDHGKIQQSRVGEVLVLAEPCTTVYKWPQERVLFNVDRDCNPFFHMMEAMWMLAGRNDVKWIGQFNSTFHQFSDNGKTFHGAYGHRWRNWWRVDQLVEVIDLLKKDPETRRAVLTMWDPYTDLNFKGKDFPCNMVIHFEIRFGRLRMIVHCRSNDIIWGAYGANAVHMSILQEYIAAMVGVPMGKYYQVSDNFHAYTEVLGKLKVPDPAPYDPYDLREVTSMPMVEDPETWGADLDHFFEDPYEGPYSNSFFNQTLVSMYMAWFSHKDKRYNSALHQCSRILAPDWRRACTEWIIRRQKNYEAKGS